MLKLIAITEVKHESIIDYKMAFIKNLKEVSRVVCMSSILEELEYFAWLKRNRVENYYFMIDDSNPDYIIGDCMLIRGIDGNNQKGTIGYSVRPDERYKHNGTHMLKLLLEKCKELAIKEINISCLEKNIASQKVIINNGGKLDKRYFDIKACDYGFEYQIALEEPGKTLVKN